MVMKSKNAIIKNLPYLHSDSTYNPKLFGGRGTAVPPAAPPGQAPPAGHPLDTTTPKSIKKQNTDPKGGVLPR